MKYLIILFSISLLVLSSTSLRAEVLEYPEGLVVIGHGGDNPAKAVRDAMRQIRELFGVYEIVSETRVEDFVVTRDEIMERGFFAGSRLDRFYGGIFILQGQHFALFEFPRAFVDAVRDRDRNIRHTVVEADFKTLRFTLIDRLLDSFGEPRVTKREFVLPTSIRHFIDYYVVDLDKFGSARYELDTR